MSGLEKTNIERLNELGNEVIENMNEIQPVEMPCNAEAIEKPEIEEVKKNPNISFKGGMCMCSCDLTCTRA